MAAPDTSDKVSVAAASSKGVILFVAVITGFFTPFMDSSVRIALPSIAQELSADAVMTGWIATSALLASAMFLVPFGRLADIHGRRKIFTLGIIIFTVASLLSATAASVGWLVFFRMVQGLGTGMIYGVSFALVSSVFPPGERGRALGIYVAAVYLGLSLGLPLGGLMTQHFGWRSIFWLSAGGGTVVVSAVLWKLRGEWAEARGQKFDLTGSAIYCLGLVAFMYGLTSLPEMLGAWLIAAGAVLLLLFVRWELRSKSPVLSLGLFRHNGVFTFSNLVAMIHYCATSGSGFLLSLYLQYIRGFSPQGAGLLLISMPVVQTVLSPFVGRLSDRVEPRVLVSTGLACTTIGLSSLTFLTDVTNVAYITVSLVVLGMGFGLFASPNGNAVMSSVQSKSYGVASATVQTMRTIGQLVGMGITLLIFSLFIGRVEITPEYYPSFLVSLKTALGVFAAVSFGGVMAAYFGTRVRKTAPYVTP